jgi:hypothetical protein
MTILRGPKAWHRERPKDETRRASDLTPEEQANVRRALLVLRTRLGGYEALAAALRVNAHTLRYYAKAKGRPSAGVAIRAARLAGASVDDVLAGKWPIAGACPHCGRL